MPVNSFDDYPMSWKPDLKSHESPKYKVLAQILENDIKEKRLLPGTKLPPQRELADYLDINLSTVSRAFKICEQKGLISAAVGSGTFVASDSAAGTILLGNHGDNPLIEMGAILPGIEMNHYLAEFIQKMSLEPDFSKYLQYGMPNGTSFQREAAVNWLKKANYHVNSDEIMLANGGQNAITASMASLFQPGDRIGTDPVIYPGVKTAAQMLGIQLIPIQQEGNEITEEGLLYACKTEKIKGLYLIPDYHNPTTHTMSLDKRMKIAKIAEQYKLIILEDAINTFLYEKPLPPIASFAPDNTVYFCSLSKVIAPGLRLSYITAPLEYRKRLAAALYNTNISVSYLMAEIAARLILNGLGEIIAGKRRIAIEQRNIMVDNILGNTGITRGGSKYELLGDKKCPFRWFILPEPYTGETFELYAKNAGVLVYSAERFAVGKAVVPRAVRMAVTSEINDDEFKKGVELLKSILKNDEEGMTFY